MGSIPFYFLYDVVHMVQSNKTRGEIMGDLFSDAMMCRWVLCAVIFGAGSWFIMWLIKNMEKGPAKEKAVIASSDVNRRNYDEYIYQEERVGTPFWWIKRTLIFLTIVISVYMVVNPTYKRYMMGRPVTEIRIIRSGSRASTVENRCHLDTVAVMVFNKWFQQDSIYLYKGADSARIYRIEENEEFTGKWVYKYGDSTALTEGFPPADAVWWCSPSMKKIVHWDERRGCYLYKDKNTGQIFPIKWSIERSSYGYYDNSTWYPVKAGLRRVYRSRSRSRPSNGQPRHIGGGRRTFSSRSSRR